MRVGTKSDKVATSAGGMTLFSFLLPILLVIVVVGVNVIFQVVANPAARLKPHYYVSLGDSLTFGFQPDDNITDGFTDDLFASLRQASVTDLENYACGGESTTTMINGGCQFKFATHVRYTGPQLSAAIAFIKAHLGQVDPVTLEIGANDVLKDFDVSTCSIGSSADADLATLDTNLTQTILPRLIAALTTSAGSRNADLVLLNYYNPFALSCPSSSDFIHRLNDHLVADAAHFRIPVVDVYSAFGGDSGTAANVCTYTWICSSFHDFHPTTHGYQIIATAVQQVLAYPTDFIPNPLETPAIPPASQ
jgi:lysophospholipase L1-like esterase